MSSRRRKKRQPRWVHYSDEELLDLRFCDLRLSLKNTRVARHIDRLHAELAQRGLKFRPHVWVADEWFSPDGVPGFAVPFYLAHPRLARLERKIMQEVEGGNANWLMRILRHETGHAIDSAYRIRRRKDWRRTFGRASISYPKIYRPKPSSQNFVLHLGHWYAQTHPTEDFAETFAVWLQPRSRWRRAYADWPALRKLNFVDSVMREIAIQPQKVRAREVLYPLSENKRTLREHYRRELLRFRVETTKVYDQYLLKVFSRAQIKSGQLSASALLRGERRYFLRELTKDVRIHAYLVHNVLRAIIERCRALKLNVRGSRRECRQAALRLIERIAFDTLYRHRQQYAL